MLFVQGYIGIEVDNQRILFDDVELSSKQRRKNSYIVMQDVNRQLFGSSVLEECMLGNEHVSEERITHVLEKLHLEGLNEIHPLSLSGGQKQRLAVAVSLIGERNVLICDEPTSGLDYRSMMAVGKLLQEVASSGKVVCVITHDTEFIRSCCNRCLLLEKDALREVGDHPKIASQMSSKNISVVSSRAS